MKKRLEEGMFQRMKPDITTKDVTQQDESSTTLFAEEGKCILIKNFVALYICSYSDILFAKFDKIYMQYH